MAQPNLTQISAKIDPETIAKIDRFTKHHYYWKRNTIINGILTAVVNNFTDDEIYDMIRFNPHFDDKTEASFKLITYLE